MLSWKEKSSCKFNENVMKPKCWICSFCGFVSNFCDTSIVLIQPDSFKRNNCVSMENLPLI